MNLFFLVCLPCSVWLVCFSAISYKTCLWLFCAERIPLQTKRNSGQNCRSTQTISHPDMATTKRSSLVRSVFVCWLSSVSMSYLVVGFSQCCPPVLKTNANVFNKQITNWQFWICCYFLVLLFFHHGRSFLVISNLKIGFYTPKLTPGSNPEAWKPAIWSKDAEVKQKQ